jgi:hypothetical protein
MARHDTRHTSVDVMNVRKIKKAMSSIMLLSPSREAGKYPDAVHGAEPW